MGKDFVIETIADAFVALNSISDDDALSMLKVKDVNMRTKSNKLNENKSFSVSNFNQQELDEAQKFLEDNKDETELEVIDADADSIDHIKNKEDYVGQAILSCNKCKAKRFIDLAKLVADEDDPDLYNVEDECPYCKTSGAGYELVGQVGQVEKDEPLFDNDAAPEDTEATFDNDVEQEPEETPVEEEKPEEKKSLKLKLKKEEPVKADTLDLDDFDFPELGEAFDPDNGLKADESNIYEAFKVNEEASSNAEEAWMMNQVISCMDNEDAYYGAWLYIWPDEETREECEYDFSDDESFEDLKETFIDTYKEYHTDGLYDAPEDVEAYAHKWDEILDLPEIENIKKFKREAIEEAKDEESEEEEEEKIAIRVADFFNLVVDPEKMEDIRINEYEGSYEDAPSELLDLNLTSFNVADGHLVINVKPLDENVDRTDPDNAYIFVNELLELFEDEETEKINLVDADSFDEIYEGNKEGAMDNYGNYGIVSIEKPEVLSMIGTVEGEEAEEPAEAEAPVDESLFEQICKANNLYAYKAKRYNTEEFWLKENLDSAENLEEVYSKYCVNEDLRSKFKAQFNFKDANDYLATIKENLITNENCAVVCGYRNNNRPYILEDAIYVNTKAQLDTAIEKVCHNYMVDKDNVIVEYYPVTRAYYVTVGKGYWNSTKQDAVADLDNATIYINEDKAAEDCKDAYQWFNRSCNVVCMESTFDKSALFESMVNAAAKKNSKNINESWNKEQIERITKLGGALGLTKAADIYKFADDRGIDKNDGDALAAALEAELNSIAEKEEKDAHVVATANDGQTYMSIDGGANWEQCSQEEYDELLAGGYKEISMNESLNEELPKDFDRTKIKVYIDKNYEDGEDAACRLIDKVIKKFKLDKTKDADLIQGIKYYIADADADGIFYESLNEAVEGSELSLEKIEMLRKAARAASDVVKAIKTYYDIDVNVAKVIGDIFQDLGILDENINLNNVEETITVDQLEDGSVAIEAMDALLWELAGEELYDIPEEKVEAISALLDGPQFSTESLKASVASDEFKAAAKAGEIPYVEPDQLDEALVKNSPLNVNIDLGNFGGEGNDVGVMNTELGEELDENLLDIFKAVCVKKPLEEDNELIPTEEPAEVLEPTEVLESEDARLAGNVGRIAHDICEAIEQYYGIEADYDLVVADILRDINLVSGRIDPNTLDDNNLVDRVTKEMYNDYEAMYDFIDALVSALTGQDIHSTREDKLTAALNALESDNFSTETIFAGIGSDRFIEAARRGAIPFIGREQALALEAPADEALIKDSPVNINIDAHEFGGKNNVVDVLSGGLGEEVDESVEVNTELFDKELNEYFKDNYATPVVYATNKGSINDKGQIVLEGVLSSEDVDKEVTFTLTPMQPLTEALETAEDVHKALGCTDFKVENNVSEEVFKFNFANDTPDKEIFEIKEQEKIGIIKQVLKDEKDIEKYLNMKEVIDAAAEIYFSEHRAELEKLGIDVCHIANQLMTVIDKIDSDEE